MKLIAAMILVSLIAVARTDGAEKEKHLFILSGQSNMARLDPKETFTPAVAAEFGADTVIVVKDAHGGEPIRRWYKQWKPAKGDEPKASGDLYDRLMTQVRAATKDSTLKTVTFVWMQGERDAREQHGEVYAASLKGLIDQLGKDMGRNDINVVIGRLSDFGFENKQYPHSMMVRRAQVEVAEAIPYAAWVDTDDLNDGKDSTGKDIKNDLHGSVEGYRTLGTRFAEKAIALIKRRAEKPAAGAVK
jgi:hypothetical protein